MANFLHRLFQDLLHISPLRNSEEVDTTEWPGMRCTTSLTLCKTKKGIFLEITMVVKTRFAKNTSAFYWSLAETAFPALEEDLRRVLAALENPERGTIKGRWIERALLWFEGFRIIRDLGSLRMTDGTAKATGFIAEKRGISCFLLSNATASEKSLYVFSRTALSRILEWLSRHKSEFLVIGSGSDLHAPTAGC